MYIVCIYVIYAMWFLIYLSVFFLYYIVFHSKIWVLKWVLGQASHPYVLSRGKIKFTKQMKEEKFQFILTGRLNQDCVGNLFSIIRGKGGKIPVDTCQDCSNQLILPKLLSLYDELSVYEFVQNKTYQEVGCLVYPTPAIITFVDRLETLLCGHMY